MMTLRALSKHSIALAVLGCVVAGSFGVARAEDTTAPSATGAMTVVDKSPAGELSLWNQIKDSQNADDFANYLDNFPNGMFADPAKDRYESLSGRKFEPNSPTDMSTSVPEQPAVTTAPEQPAVTAKPRTKAAAKVGAKPKPRATATLKKKKSSATASAKLKKKPTKKSVAFAKPARKKKSQVASNRKSCLGGILGDGCSPPKRRAVTSGGGEGGGGGGSGGGGGGGAGGWH
jgi:hypothetical protein